MTSIIQVMNSRGVAFATDSAVSYGDHSRNSAQKLFSLPGRQPIAFMTMGSGTFAPAGLSWDRIFYKYNLHYSEKYGTEAELGTVEEYEKDFIGFLETLVSHEDNEEALSWDIWNRWAGEGGIYERGGYLDISEDDSPDEEVEEAEERPEISPEIRGLEAIKRLLVDWENTSWWMSAESYDDIEFQYKTEQIEKHHADSLKKATEWILMSALTSAGVPRVATWEEMWESIPSESQEVADLCKEQVLLMLKRWLAAWGNIHKWKEGGSYASVIFGGFGKNNDFPSSIHIVTGSRVSGLGNSADLLYDRNVVDPHIHSPQYEKESGTWKCVAFLEALAQNEFILRMTLGMSEAFREGEAARSATHSIDGWIKFQAAETIGQVEGVSEELAKSVVSHLKKEKISSEIGDHFGGWVHSEQTDVKRQFRVAVSRLSPVEMAELASDLIGVQAKMHNIVYSQASVDLPVDVCYLSKENGFVWHSRKNMPDLELNPRISSMDWAGSQLD